MISTSIQRASNVTNIVFNHKYNNIKKIFLRLCKKSSHQIWTNNIWKKNTLHAFERFPHKYKHVVLSRKYSTEICKDYEVVIASLTKQEPEHKIMHSMLQNSVHYKNTIIPPIKTQVEISYDEICKLYTINWSFASISYIYDVIKKLSYCHLSGSRFETSLYNDILHACSEKLDQLEDEQIKTLIQHLIVLTDETRQSNYWPIFLNTLDKLCLKRFYPSKTEELLLMADAFYQLGHYESNYMWRALRKIATKPSKLSAKNFVQLFFLLKYGNINSEINMFEIEYCVQECISELSANEIGIIARGFFLNKRRVRNRFLIAEIIRRVNENIKSMDSTALASVMKLIRYSDCNYYSTEFSKLLNSVEAEIPRLSLKCLTHVAHAFGGVRVYNETFIQKLLKRTIDEIQYARLKDIERILFGICTVTPNVSYYQEICNKLLNEVLLNYQTRRSEEVNKFPLSLARIVTFLTVKNIYIPELIQYVLDPTFIQKIHKNNISLLASEVLVLHCSVKIELPSYQGPFLTEKMYKFLVKKFSLNDDIHKKDINAKFRTEITYICKNNFGIDVCVDTILPHYFTRDIVFGFDKDNNCIEIESILSSMPAGSIKYVNSEELKSIKWNVLYPLPNTLKVLGHDGYIGPVYGKINQLRIIGYTPILIHESEWNSFTKEEEKVDYLRKLIYGNHDDSFLNESVL